MSQSNAGAASASASLMQSIMAHIYAGAAYVVRMAHRIEVDWLKLKTADPQMATLIEQGAVVAEAEMVAHGIDVPDGMVLADHVAAAVEAMAAHANDVVAAPAPAATATKPVTGGTVLGILLGLSLLGGVAACSVAQQATVESALATPAGQLFCSLQKPTGTIVAPIIDGAATAANPLLGAVAVLATGALAADVQADCDQAAKNVGAVAGIPVSPPAVTAGLAPVAIIPQTTAQ